MNPKIKSHPLVKKIRKGKRQKGINDKKIADFLCISQRTLYRRYEKPGTFTSDEIDDLSILFGWRDGTTNRFLEV